MIYITLISIFEIGLLCISHEFILATEIAKLIGCEYVDISTPGAMWQSGYFINFLLLTICSIQYTFDRVIPKGIEYYLFYLFHIENHLYLWLLLYLKVDISLFYFYYLWL